MRFFRHAALTGLALSMFPVAATAQLRPSAGTLVNGKVVVLLFVSLADSVTRYFPVALHRLNFYRSANDSTTVVTDSIGSATTALSPGQYRLVSSRPVTWRGYEYSWSVPITVRPGMAVIDLRSPDAVAAAPIAVRAEEPERAAERGGAGVPRANASIQVVHNPQERDGAWFTIGMGTGSLGCSDCADRVNGLSGGLGVGGTINQHLYLGAFTSGWYKSESGVTLNAGVLVAGVRYYPSETSGFFMLGGLGISSVNVTASGYGSANTTGSGALLGLGWDFRIASNVSLTPFWNGVGISSSDGDANYGQIGVGITIH